ncbi:hypothetical protein [Kitasatospora sp. RG8]|uniref:hypothetical protein n=1 Tax=Kitasatospora sp. RG8 TaxID=2820815 RepID=UPI001FD7487B|nr:hypothetical protein [Kitasatospora sp. RG8]
MSRIRRIRRRKAAGTTPVIKRTSRTTPRPGPAVTGLPVQTTVTPVAALPGAGNHTGPGPV